ncbi:MAG: hypothetical protein WBR29_07440 [Gammaproteobacteria bacterium]
MPLTLTSSPSPTVFDRARQIAQDADAPDPRIDIVTAYRLAEADAMELRWLAEAHKTAWAEHRLDDQIRLLARMRAIKGPVPAPPCTFTRRRAFAHHFTTW